MTRAEKRIVERYDGSTVTTSVQYDRTLVVGLGATGLATARYLATLGADVTVIECDCEVQRVYPYRGKTPDAVGGGGGTAFDPVMQYVRDNRQLQFDGIVYLTDGYAEKPTISPTCRLLWVVTPDGTTEYLAFGANIQLT